MNPESQRGGRMREERKRLGLSQQALADAAGVSREMWSRYESGAEPGANALGGAAERGVDVYYVLTGHRAAGATVLTARENSLVENYRAAPEAAKKALETTSAYMAKAPAGDPPAQRKTNISVGSNHGQVVEGGVVNNGPVSFGKGRGKTP